jgi:formate-dependent phosphoribosylglycinamide formyltransferase (GAR transformylase)
MIIRASWTRQSLIGDERAMGLPRPQFTLRRLLVAVAVVSLICESHALWRRSLDLRLRAARYDVSASFHKSRSDHYRTLAVLLAKNEHTQNAEKEAREAAFYERVAEEYRYAALRPWIDVNRDAQPP